MIKVLKIEFFEGAILKNTYVLKCIFWGSNFDAHLCSEMYFFEGTILKALMFWNAFFVGAFILKFMVAD